MPEKRYLCNLRPEDIKRYVRESPYKVVTGPPHKTLSETVEQLIEYGMVGAYTEDPPSELPRELMDAVRQAAKKMKGRGIAEIMIVDPPREV